MTFLPRLLLALPLACAATAAQAHPHVVIDMSSDVVFDDAGKISAINVTWIFDKNYTAMATDGLDVPGYYVGTSTGQVFASWYCRRKTRMYCL